MTDKIKLQKLQLMRSIKDTDFFVAYKKLITNNYKKLNKNEKFLLLKFAVIFLNYGEKELEKFGYKIILTYSNLFDNYVPLYDVAINKNYIPVAKFITNNYLNFEGSEQSFHKLLMSSYKENFKHIRNGKSIFFSAGQKKLYEFSKNIEDFIIVAPTSYGKSELIVQKIENNLNKNICVIVPTKSLLAQTKKNLIKSDVIRDSKKKIITHPDMLYDKNISFIAVLTQERLLRLLQNDKELSFEIVLIDEAHNIINNNSREILTIQDLKLLKKRSDKTHFYYFTPFLVNPKNIKVFSEKDILKIQKIQEFIKVEKYYTLDFTSKEKNLKIYDQFLNLFFNINKHIKTNNEFSFINSYAASKNIIYINRPKHIEEFSSSIKNPIKITEEIIKVQKALKDFLHKDYNLIKTLENGVVYHHGGMPENVRLYVENAFSKIENIKYIVTSSTLLQGVNIPAEKIFLLTTKIGLGNLNASQFKNLSGRICRFNEVFDYKKGSLRMLEPEIYVLKGKYSDKRSNIEQFLQNRVKDNKIIKDEIKNPLLKHNLETLNKEDLEKFKESEEYLENIEQGTSTLNDTRIVTTEIAKACFKNNIHDFDIFNNEKQLNENYKNIKNIEPISNADALILRIGDIFLWKITLNQNKTNNFKRLEISKAKEFYSMLLSWRSSGKSYGEMINSFMWYWANKKSDSYIYVGTKWGEETSPYKEGFRKLYIDLSKKTYSQKINIAILRIKEEEDFIDYNLMPYIEILNDLKLIEQKFYYRIKYGTDDIEIITMLKEGFSIELSKTLKNKIYSNYINVLENYMKINSNIINVMKKNNENEILIFEIQYHIH